MHAPSKNCIIQNLKRLPPEKVLFGHTAAMQEFRYDLSQACMAHLPVLLVGEIGVGKRTLSRYIHQHWFAGRGRYAEVSCASIDRLWAPFALHAVMKCSVPVKRQPRAQDERVATLFLNAVDELPVRLQRLLATLLMDHNGDYNFSPHRGPICIVSSSTLNLREQADEGYFRRDLFEELTVATLYVPPLRERIQDLPEICEYMRRCCCEILGIPGSPLPSGLLDSMLMHNWPGNLSELADVVSRYVGRGPQSYDSPQAGENDLHNECCYCGLPPWTEATPKKARVVDPIDHDRSTSFNCAPSRRTDTHQPC